VSPQLRLWRPESVDSCPDILIEAILEGVHEAGNPWFDYLFGSSETAVANLRQWVHRSSSEIYVARCTLLSIESECVGGYLALSGAELAKCRRADGLALLMKTRPEERRHIEQRLENARDLFPSPGDNEYYLSKIWVAPSHRGRGYSKPLMEAWLEQGRQAGFNHYRLDVSADRVHARRVYEQLGFITTGQNMSADRVLAYLTMTRNEGAE
jgi:predicted GNAT family N-acyltransferase